MFQEFIKTGFAYAGVHPIRVEVKCLRRGTIKKFRLIQTAGPTSGFSYALYNRRTACPPDNSPPSDDRDLYRIMPYGSVETGEAGAPDADTFDMSVAYSNMDAGSTNASASLYLEIDPNGSDPAMRFALAMTIEGVSV